MISQPLLSSQLKAKHCYQILKKLYQVTTRHNMPWVMDDGDFDERVKILKTAGQIAIHQSDESDSCGAVSQNMVNIMLGKGNRLESGSHLTHSLDETKQFIDQDNLPFPCMMRIQVARKDDKGSWVDSHSIAPIIYSLEDLNTVSGYVGFYTASQYLTSPTWKQVRQNNDSKSLPDLLDSLKSLESESAIGRTQAYNHLFRPCEHAGKKSIRLGFQQIIPTTALANIIDKIDTIKALVHKYPQMVGNSYTTFMAHLLNDTPLGQHQSRINQVLESLDELKAQALSLLPTDHSLTASSQALIVSSETPPQVSQDTQQSWWSSRSLWATAGVLAAGAFVGAAIVASPKLSK